MTTCMSTKLSGLPISAPTKQREWKGVAYHGSFQFHASIIRMGGGNCIENISSNLFMYLHGGSVSFFLLGRKIPTKCHKAENSFQKEVFTTSSLFIKDASLFYRCVIYAKPWVTSSTVYKIAGTVNDIFFCMTRRSVICPYYIRSLNSLLYKYDYKNFYN